MAFDYRTPGAAALAALLATTAAPAMAEEVNIGVILSQSGNYAFVGVPVVNGMRLAYDEIVEAGGFGDNTVNFEYEDNRSDRAEAVTLVGRFARDADYDMIVGPIATSEAMATAPIANEMEIPMFTTATSPDVLAIGEWIFKSTETADAYMEPVALYVANELQPESCFVVGIRDNEGYVTQRRIVTDLLSSNGVEIAAEETILSTDVDFTALSTTIVNTAAPCLFVTAPPETAANVIIQARQAGMDPETILLGDSGMGSQQFMDAGGSAVDGAYFPASFVIDATEMSRQFAADYEEAYGNPPDIWAATGYTMMYVVANAVANAEEISREDLRAAMAATSDIPVVMGQGSLSFDENRVPHMGGVVMRISDGTWVAPE
ncbi:ABC transporter substrate-binding protein [Rhodobacterales bacterium HKCCE2091]|nr:ABC transporter substrate-binding protein [Rhodobacterales bacterium HKCCE2091]